MKKFHGFGPKKKLLYMKNSFQVIVFVNTKFLKIYFFEGKNLLPRKSYNYKGFFFFFFDFFRFSTTCFEPYYYGYYYYYGKYESL